MTGIYKYDDGRLVLCLARILPWVKGDQGPRRFAIEPTSSDILLELERPSTAELAIIGSWVGVRRTEDGKALPTERTFAVFHWYDDVENSFSIVDSMSKEHVRDILSGRWAVDTTKQPKELSFFTWVGRQEQELHGIYKLDANRLTIAYRKDGPRPEKFESTAGSGVTLLVLERKDAGPEEEERKGGEAGAMEHLGSE